MTPSEYFARFDGPLARAVRRCLHEVPPDPWTKEMDEAVRSPHAVPLCLDCLYPQTGHRWFCPHCGHISGEFVTTMPYLPVFADGEFFRKGVIGPPEKRIGVQLFLALYSLACYSIFAPIYWFWMFRRAVGKPICHVRRIDLPFDEEGQN